MLNMVQNWTICYLNVLQKKVHDSTCLDIFSWVVKILVKDVVSISSFPYDLSCEKFPTPELMRRELLSHLLDLIIHTP